MRNRENLSRRELLRAGAAPLIVSPLLGAVDRAGATPAADPWRGIRVGVASYTLRNMPLEACIKAIQRVGLHYVSIKDTHLPMSSTAEQRKTVAKQYKDAGITPLSCGNGTMENDEARIRRAFEYARDTALPTIVCSPHPDSFPILDRMVKEFEIRLAIHNHGPGDNRFPSPYDAYKASQSFDKRIGLCIDVGHTARAGIDPAEAIRKCRERLYDLHFKDLSSSAPDGAPVEVGRGVLDKRAILQALLDIRYSSLMSFEYEKDAIDPLPGLAESVGYTRGVFESLR